MSLITWFEQQFDRRYPIDAKTILESTIQNTQPLKVNFKFDNYGDYQVLDFTLLNKILNGQTSALDSEDSASNPFFIIQEITSFIEQYVPEKLKHRNILPFARATFADKCWYIYFAEGNPHPIVLDTNWIYSKPIQSRKPISKYIQIERILAAATQPSEPTLSVEFDTKVQPDEINPKSQILITDAECVDSVEDYKQLITRILKLSADRFILTSFNGKEDHSIRTIDLTINGHVHGRLILQGNTDWVDLTLITQLNDLLSPHLDEFKFVEFRDANWGQELGIIYANQERIADFVANGYVNS